MFQHATKYNTQMTNILLIFFNIEIRNKQIIEEKDKSIHNLQGVLEKEQKFKAKLQVKKHENNEVLIKLELAKHNINIMEKHNKDLQKIKVEKDYLQATFDTY